MNFGFEEEQELLRREIRKFLDEQCPMEEVRRLAQSSDGYSREQLKQLAELGWLGLVLAEMGDLESAERELASAAERIPAHGRIRYNRALALQSLGREGPALALLQELEAQSPDDPEVQNALAVLHVQMGDLDAAVRHAERLVELTHRAPAALALLEQIRAGR